MNIQQLFRAITLAFVNAGLDQELPDIPDANYDCVSEDKIQKVFKAKIFVHNGEEDYNITEVYIQDGSRLIINVEKPRKYERSVRGK